MKNLKYLRKDRNLTQKELAEILHVKYNSISEWETGKSAPHLDIIIAISKYFDVTVGFLLGLEEKSGVNYPNRYVEADDREKNVLKKFRTSGEIIKKSIETLLNIQDDI